MKLLIVDDHDINRKLLRAQLEGEGHEVRHAADGVEALELLALETVDGIVSDILMPRMDGYRLCIEIRNHSDYRGLPFILYTSTYNSPDDLQLAESVGVDAYIAKPAPTAQLVAALVAASETERIKRAQRVPMITEPAPLMKQYNEVLIRKLEEKGLELERTHEGLLETQARLSGLIASAMDAIIAVDEMRRIVLFNAAAGRMFRCDPDAALGRPLNEFIPSGSREIHERHMAAFAHEQEISRAMGPRDVSALRADGTEFPIEANISRLPTSQGQLFTVFIRDVTERHRSQAALKQSEAGLLRAQDMAQMGHAIINARGEVENRSASFAAMLGVAIDKVPRNVTEWITYIHEEDRPKLQWAVEEARRFGRRADVEYNVRRGAEWRRVRQIIEPLEQGAGAGGLRTISTFQDVTAERHKEEHIKRLNRVYAVLSEINSLIVRVTDRDDLFGQACRIAVETGRLAKAWIGMLGEGFDPVKIVAWAGTDDAFFEDLQLRLAANASKNEGLLARALSTGQPVICNDIANDPVVVERTKLLDSGSLSLVLLPLVINERVAGILSIHAPTTGFFDAEETDLLLGLANDIAFALDHLMKAERLHFIAHHDTLTTLPNRLRFAELLTAQLSQEVTVDALACVALVDLVRFRRINETLGRRGGDVLLAEVAERLLHADPTAARIGSNLFALRISGRRSAADLARHLDYVAQTCFALPFDIGGEEVRIGCRIGAAVFPGDGADAEELLRNAEAALRKSRSLAEMVVFYSADMNSAVNDALVFETRLRRAIEREEFVLHYQPKVCLADRRIVGAEALIRWNDPDDGLVLPMHFIPVLEETGLIATVGRWALRRALDEAAQWHASGTARLRVAVNVSPLQLNQPNFGAQVAALIAPDDGDMLELEITESVIMDDVERTITLLAQLRELGVQVAVDDFGTGYSSLAYISQLPITSLKIDRAFIAGMTTTPQGYILVSSIIALAHSLNLKVVAEGVETEEQAQLLNLLRCDEAQGYLFSRPLQGDKMLELLLADRALP